MFKISDDNVNWKGFQHAALFTPVCKAWKGRDKRINKRISGIYSTNVSLMKCMKHRLHWVSLLSLFSFWFGANETFNIHNALSLGFSMQCNYSRMPNAWMSVCGGRGEQGGLILKLQSSIHPWWLLEIPITHQQNVIAQFSLSMERYQYGLRRLSPDPLGLLWVRITPHAALPASYQCFTINAPQWGVESNTRHLEKLSYPLSPNDNSGDTWFQNTDKLPNVVLKVPTWCKAGKWLMKIVASKKADWKYNHTFLPT